MKTAEIVWSTEVPGRPGWYAMEYTVNGEDSSQLYPAIEFLSEEDLSDYQEDLVAGLDPDLAVWFYGPLDLEIPKLGDAC